MEAVAHGLSDGSLLREAAYVAGTWMAAAADAEAAVIAANDAPPSRTGWAG